jgi:hypothetical protein
VNTYSFYLVGVDGERAGEPIEIQQCPTDAEALAAGCRALRRAPACGAVEIWREAQRVLRLGGAALDRRPGEVEYLGRWDRAWRR